MRRLRRHRRLRAAAAPDGRRISGAQPAAGYGYAPQARYGGFWIRFVAVFIDGIIVSIPTFILGLIVGVIYGSPPVVSGNTNNQAANTAFGGASGGDRPARPS